MGKDGYVEPAYKNMEPAIRTEYEKSEKTRASNEYLAKEAKYDDGVDFAQTRANDDNDDDVEKDKTCDGYSGKRHHLKDEKTNKTNKVEGEATMAAPVKTAARVTAAAWVTTETATTPRKACTPTVTTTNVLVDDNDNINASSRAPPSIAKCRRY